MLNIQTPAMFKKFLFFLTLFFVSFSISASHLLGGTITYKYISSTANKITYLISIPIYRDCSDGHVELDSSIKIGIYNNDKTKTLYKSESIALASRTILTPKCSFTFTGCIELGNYAKYVTFDTSSRGYLLTYMQCCRAVHNNLSDLIWDEKGFAFVCLMAPTKYKNNAPQFIFNPTLLNGINAKNEDDWDATDSDGDSLVYEIVAPYQGGAIPNPDPTPTFKDPLFVNYVAGYSYLKPFGTNGNIYIDKSNGKLKFSNSNTGTFAFCVEIKEYRKGILIGIYRRDYPLIFVNLMPDPFGYNILLETPQLWASKFVRLYWDICPQNYAKFTIEKKQKTTNWNKVVDIVNEKYYDDSIPTTGWYYYRVKATLDNKEVISNIDSACFCYTPSTGSTKEIDNSKNSVYPNPTKEFLYFKNPSASSYAIYDLAGKLLLESKETHSSSETKIDVRFLKQGIYFIVTKTEKGLITERFIKE
jgi:hypothetical protein